VSAEVNPPVDGEYQRAPIATFEVTGSVHCDWYPSWPLTVPVVAVMLPHGSYPVDPDTALPEAVNWPVTSPCWLVRARTPEEAVPPDIPIPVSTVPDGSQV